ncbi:MAG: hypothetical protein OEU92_09275 [Alphaproteobacteria bacterium]|nr:hypothetical protein [Alphaproteobacteria bacterium]
MATDIEQVHGQIGPRIEYLEPRDLPTMHADGVRTIYVLKEKVVEHHHTDHHHSGWGFSAFNEFMNKALATFAFLCIGGVALAMLIMAFAVVSRL